MNFLDFKLSNRFRSQKPKGYYDEEKGHTGVDHVCPIGTDVRVGIPCYFVNYIKQNQMGNTLFVKDNYGNVMVFAHLSELVMPTKKGTPMPAWGLLAKSGNTGGKTTAPHVHFEVIAPEPAEGLEIMTRTLAGITGYNIPPLEYLARAEVRYRKVRSWKQWDTAKRVARATLDRLRKS